MLASIRSSSVKPDLCRVRLLLLALGVGISTAAAAAPDASPSRASASPTAVSSSVSEEPPVSCAVVLCPVGTRCIESKGTAECVPFGPRCRPKDDRPCPGAGTCIDKQNDACVPDEYRENCPGICQCDVVGLCTEGYRWDSSPFVCGCVPEAQGVTCGPTICPAGLVCCNESCGICTEPGGVCIQIACE